MIRLPVFISETTIENDIPPYFSDGDAMLNSLAEGSYTLCCAHDGRLMRICFCGELASDFMTSAGFPTSALLKRGDIPEAEDVYSGFLDICSSYTAGDDHSELSCCVLLYRLLLDIRLCFTDEYDDAMQHKRMLLAPILELIHNQSCLRDISLPDMADAAGISVIHLSRLFKEITGDTPNHYMLIKRFDNARKRLLEDMTSNIADIARSSGFSSANAFGTAFKKEFGMSPGEYREMHRGKPLPKSVQYRPVWQPLYIVNARRHEGETEQCYESPTAYRLNLCTGGSVLITTEDGSPHMMRYGDMFMNSDGSKYSFKSVSQSFSMLEICFTGERQAEIMNAFGISGQTFFTNTLDFKYDFRIPAEYIWRNFWTFDKEALLECSYNIFEILMKLYEIQLEEHRSENKEIGELTPAIDIIKLYYMRDLAVTDLSNAIGMSVSEFSAKFKKAYGMTPKKYLTQFRLKQAAYKLKNYPSMLISEISESCGFSKPSYFGSVFKSFYKMTPEEYRKTES